MENNKIRKNKEKVTTWKQDVHIGISQFHYKWKVAIVIISTCILVKIHMSLIKFNVNLDNVKFIQNIDSALLKDMPFLKIKLLYFMIYVASITTSIILIYGFYKLLKFLSKPWKTNKLAKICEQLQICYGKRNKNNLPILITERKDKRNEKIKVMEFYSNGTTVEDWKKEDRLKRISQKLNRAVVEVEAHNKDIDKILLYYRKDYSEKLIYWDNNYLINDDCSLVLGENKLGMQEIINLNDNPHWIIAGSSGSGKSVELLNLLMQNILKGNKVIVAEFYKGGVDFNKEWRNLENFTIYTEIEELLGYIVYDLSHELDVRKELLKLYNCKNISEYNRKVETKEIKGERLDRIIIALDEAGQVFIKSKDKKKEEKLEIIRKKLSEIFSMYRFCGVHCLYGTQVPSSSVFDEAIRHNSERICGRADKILSKIAIDTEDAAFIPKKSKGHFITSEGKEFQGYLFSEKEVFEGQKKQGVDKGDLQ
ncbi:MAG: hypothetical protein LBL91_03785 [Lachnospiraceae bacterium]|jgi:S-DNA-T family DNA segregation ATPase FtsK/SpoIIIE|nr:hypothetical protein [Lachnospiraceae bacterium]